MNRKSPDSRVDFSKLRAAFDALSDVFDCGGKVRITRDGVKLSDIPRSRWRNLSSRVNRHAILISELINGPGQKSSVTGRREVTIAVTAEEGDTGRHCSIALLETIGRGRVINSHAVRTSEAGWRERLGKMIPWDEVDGIIACAEGNNQRAAIGIILLLAGIGKGRLEILEVEIPEEIDESTHLVRGADWMKGGLTRFRSASGEALFSLMRVRSVHSRLVKTRKQGLYTAMAVTALHAGGASFEECSGMTGLSVDLSRRLIAGTKGNLRYIDPEKIASELGESFRCFSGLREGPELMSAMRVWRGAYVYARAMSWRREVSRKARLELAAGEGLADISSSLNISLRDLVRILSIRETALEQERERFINAILDPQVFKDIAGAGMNQS